MARSITVHPAEALRGTLAVPGDKSISNRLAILTALADGSSHITGFLRSTDCLTLLEVMRTLGARYRFEGPTLVVDGTSGRLQAPAEPLDLGNSGTGLRLLAGVLAGHPFVSELTGDASLRSRPMDRIKEPLERMGAQVELLGAKGGAPLRIRGGALRGIDYQPRVASAQVKSCVLLAGLYAQGVTRVIEPVPTRDHTERLLAAMAAPVVVSGHTVSVTGGGARLKAGVWRVPGDFSSAAFWITGAAAWPGSCLRVEGVGLNPRRCALLNVLRRMGAEIRAEQEEALGACEPAGTVTVNGVQLRGTEVGGAEIPDLIDELPLVAVAGALAQGRTVIRDAAELRVKESDRIRSVASNLTRLGVRVEERPDGLVIEGPARLRGGVALPSYGDHRVPMAMSLLALRAEQAVRLDDVDCVAKSYPEFWADLRKVGGRADAGHSD